MGIEGRPVRDFFRNRWFTPTLQTALVTALGDLPNVRGRDTIVKLAATVQGETRARFLIGSLRILGNHHRSGTRIASISTTGLVPVGRTAAGETIVAAAIDYAWWDARLDEFVRHPAFKGQKPLVLIAGRASPRAEQEFARRGWQLRTGLHPAAAPAGMRRRPAGAGFRPCTAVDDDRAADHERRGVRAQPQDGGRDLLGRGDLAARRLAQDLGRRPGGRVSSSSRPAACRPSPGRPR